MSTQESARVYKGVPQKCPTRVLNKSVLQERHRKRAIQDIQDFHTSVCVEECRTRMSYKSVLEEPLTLAILARMS